MRRLLVTGGVEFIGANFVRYWCETYPGDRLVVLDALTHAGNKQNLHRLESNPNFSFVLGNISDRALVDKLLISENIDTIIHLAAESHVDRSILKPAIFIQTNLVGIFTLLEAFCQYLETAKIVNKVLFLHISTDEVYSSLSLTEPAFTETTLYAPNSPYSASKAGSNHLVRAYFHTYGLPTIVTNCSNDYGAFQTDLHWCNLMFHEYFHSDNGAGLGASHQTGWTGLIATLIEQSKELINWMGILRFLFKTLPKYPLHQTRKQAVSGG